jgi:solute carrier family 40 (iron-regulated transporter), member 1
MMHSASESQAVVTAKMAYMLYLCHFLSTWNARVYEFGAVVFTAAAFPGGLMASSILYVFHMRSPSVIFSTPAFLFFSS